MQTVLLNMSGRSEAGNCGRICEYISGLTAGNSRIITVSEFSIHSCNKCLYECFISKDLCPYFSDDAVKVYDTLMNAEQIICMLPNYRDYPCSNYFALMERGQCYFDEGRYEKYLKIPRKFIVIANTGFENISGIVRRDFPDVGENDILRLSSREFGTSSIKGNLVEFEGVRKALRDFLGLL